MRGVVCSGSGEGRKYISMDKYKRQIEEKFNFSPYEGTLNLILEKEFFEDLKIIEGMELKGFKEGDLYFGSVKCFPIFFENERCAMLLPARSRHKEVVEVVCGMRLRDGLEDGDKVFFCFEPFIKKGLDGIFYAVPHVGNGEEKITLYYDFPFEEGRRDLCHEKNSENCYLKRFIGRDVASIIFEGDGFEEYNKLFEWIKNRGYSVISPVRKIRYSFLKEWQVEVKIKKE